MVNVFSRFILGIVPQRCLCLVYMHNSIKYWMAAIQRRATVRCRLILQQPWTWALQTLQPDIDHPRYCCDRSDVHYIEWAQSIGRITLNQLTQNAQKSWANNAGFFFLIYQVKVYLFSLQFGKKPITDPFRIPIAALCIHRRINRALRWWSHFCGILIHIFLYNTYLYIECITACFVICRNCIIASEWMSCRRSKTCDHRREVEVTLANHWVSIDWLVQRKII